MVCALTASDDLWYAASHSAVKLGAAYARGRRWHEHSPVCWL